MIVPEPKVLAGKNIPKGEKFFNEWHKKACEEVISLAGAKGKLFKIKPTYGQAQKWVNMTLKNMLVMGLWDMDDLKPYMHIPLDSYIFKAEAAKQGMGLEVRCPFKKWSGISGYDEYICYQNEIKDAAKRKGYETALDWEGDAWIKQSEIENTGD